VSLGAWVQTMDLVLRPRRSNRSVNTLNAVLTSTRVGLDIHSPTDSLNEPLGPYKTDRPQPWQAASARSFYGPLTGFRPKSPVDFEAFERIDKGQAYDHRIKWNRKHCPKLLFKLDRGPRVWIKSPNNVGHEGTVLTCLNSILVLSQSETWFSFVNWN